MGKKFIKVMPFLLSLPIFGITYLSNWSDTGSINLLVRSNIRNYHKFNASTTGTISQITIQYGPNAQDESVVDSTTIIIYSDNNGSRGSELGTFTFLSKDTIANTATYTGSVTINATGDYWIEIRQVGGNFYYRAGSALGDVGDWQFVYNSSWNWYPRMIFENPSIPEPYSLSDLNTDISLSSETYLKRGGAYLDLSYDALMLDGQTGINDLTGLADDLEGINKANITYLNLSGNPITEIPANIFSTFTNLHVLDINNCGSLTTINANAFNGLTVTGVVSIQNATTLTTLPENAFNGLITQHLRLDQNSGLTTIASGAFDGLTLSGDLRLDNNSSLTTIGSNTFNGLSVGRNLYLSNCSSLAALETNALSGLTVGGHLYLDNNSALSVIETGAFDNLEVGEDFYLHNTALATLPSGIFNGDFGTTVGITMRLHDNASMGSATDGSFKGLTTHHLRLDNNISLNFTNAKTFDQLVTTGDIRFDNNTNFSSLIENLFYGATIGGSIFFKNAGISSVNSNAFTESSVAGFLDFTDHSISLILPAAVTNNFTVIGYD
jgi:hypothetical protein